MEGSYGRDLLLFFIRPQKYIDIFAGTFGFWLFGYAVSANTDRPVLGEEQDYIFWFFRVRFQPSI